MAKIQLRPRAVARRVAGVEVAVVIYRMPGEQFEACARISSAATRECKKGKNPREAVGRALMELGRKTRLRKGAFAVYEPEAQLDGYGRKRGRRRR